jgi:hypothetical protein
VITGAEHSYSLIYFAGWIFWHGEQGFCGGMKARSELLRLLTSSVQFSGGYVGQQESLRFSLAHRI